jgi:hypothetical protein
MAYLGHHFCAQNGIIEYQNYLLELISSYSSPKSYYHLDFFILDPNPNRLE